MKTVKLVDSTYPADKAREVIISLLNDKIRFINLQIFSLEERHNLDSEHLKERLRELAEERDQVAEILKAHSGKNTPVKINCDIQIEVLAGEMIEGID